MTSAALLLSKLTDAELAQRAWLELDALTSTDLERELLKRFSEHVAGFSPVLDEHSIEDAQELAKALQALGTHDYDLAGALLEVLSTHVVENAQALDTQLQLAAVLREFDIDNPQALRRLLERDAKFTDLMNDLAQPLASLQALATTE